MKRREDILIRVLLAVYLLFAVVFAAGHSHDDGKTHEHCPICQFFVLSAILTCLLTLPVGIRFCYSAFGIESQLPKGHAPDFASSRSPPSFPFEK